NLDTLNRAWNTRYADWEQVMPEGDKKHKYSSAIEIEWLYFMHNIRMELVLRSRARVIRETDPMQRPVFAHVGAPNIGAGYDWTHARCQDFLGSSCYPAWVGRNKWDDGFNRPFLRKDSLRTEMWHSVAMRYDYIRSANLVGHPVWAAEFQGGPGSNGFHKGRVPSAEDIRRWMLTAVGSGVTAIAFWVTRAEIAAEECNGFSLLDSVGDTTPRFEEATRVGQALNRHAGIFGQTSMPQAAVAIFINERNYQHCATMSQGGEHLGYSVQGWHRLLWDAGIPVDFVEAMELDEPYLAKYKAIIMPFPLALSEEVATKLARYVEAGGNLISEACPGRINEYAFCNRGELSPAMAELFGVRQTGFTMVREPEGGQRWSPAERTWGEYLDPVVLQGAGHLAGQKLRANVYVETYEPQSSEICLRYGKAAAGVVRKCGKGQAWLLGTFVGHNGIAYRNTATNKCVLKILADAGVKPEHDGKLLLRKRKTTDKPACNAMRSIAGREAWIFTNNASQDIVEEIDVQGWKNAEDLLEGPLAIKADRIKLKVKSLDVKVLIVSR
ncbi:MAG: beta-galactosidase trimerization domain-containing protein, partial [Verrucomicrobia bacterium]|nr:beta-galactosidase trimerization domain-containing protein [Verrucomicrobiota bacterium]